MSLLEEKNKIIQVIKNIEEQLHILHNMLLNYNADDNVYIKHEISLYNNALQKKWQELQNINTDIEFQQIISNFNNL